MTFKELKTELDGLLDQLPGEKSLYVKFIDSENVYAKNESAPFWAASVIKIPIIIELYRQVETGLVDLETRINIKEENMVQGSGIAHLLNKNNDYTIKDLAKLSIILSDNAATNEMVDLIGWENVEKYLHEIGLEQTTFKHKMMISANRGPNLTTAKEISKLLEKLHLKALPYAEEILNLLNQTKLRDRIPKYISGEIKTCHKTGSLRSAVHDVGIIYSEPPFIFSFLSDDQDDKELTKDTIAKCAKLCFDFVNND